MKRKYLKKKKYRNRNEKSMNGSTRDIACGFCNATKIKNKIHSQHWNFVCNIYLPDFFPSLYVFKNICYHTISLKLIYTLCMYLWVNIFLLPCVKLFVWFTKLRKYATSTLINVHENLCIIIVYLYMNLIHKFCAMFGRCVRQMHSTKTDKYLGKSLQLKFFVALIHNGYNFQFIYFDGSVCFRFACKSTNEFISQTYT